MLNHVPVLHDQVASGSTHFACATILSLKWIMLEMHMLASFNFAIRDEKILELINLFK